MRQIAQLLLVVMVTMEAGLPAGAFGEAVSAVASSPTTKDTKQIVVQIFGRRCEYYPQDVEGALRRFTTVQAVRFLNNHGTVLVIYRPGDATPEQFADEVERTLAMGWGCKVRAQ